MKRLHILGLLLLSRLSVASAAIIDFQFSDTAQATDGGDFVLEYAGADQNSQSNITVSDTFSNAFGAGLDLGVSVDVTSARNDFTDSISSAPSPGLNVIGDGFGERFAGPTTVTLTLGAGDYDFTSWHHMDGNLAGFVGDLTVEIDTGSGFSTLTTTQTVTSSDTPVSISTFSTSFTANGTDDVVVRYSRTSGSVYVTNGIEVAAVIPEPSSLALAAGALVLMVGISRRRRG